MSLQQSELPRRWRLRLVSASPRRRLLLPLLGFPVETASAGVDEQPLPGETPPQTALRLALLKAEAAGAPRTGEAVIGADTIVALEGRQFGKPADGDEARAMLRALRGRQHEVVTGVAVLATDRRHLGAVHTSVTMRAYTDAEIERYIASGRPMDKAGAYAIQDYDFDPVARSEGCYLNVVGLPLCEVSRGLRALGWPLPEESFIPPCRLCQLGQSLLSSGRLNASSPASRSASSESWPS